MTTLHNAVLASVALISLTVITACGPQAQFGGTAPAAKAAKAGNAAQPVQNGSLHDASVPADGTTAPATSPAPVRSQEAAKPDSGKNPCACSDDGVGYGGGTATSKSTGGDGDGGFSEGSGTTSASQGNLDAAARNPRTGETWLVIKGDASASLTVCKARGLDQASGAQMSSAWTIVLKNLVITFGTFDDAASASQSLVICHGTQQSQPDSSVSKSQDQDTSGGSN